MKQDFSRLAAGLLAAAFLTGCTAYAQQPDSSVSDDASSGASQPVVLDTENASADALDEAAARRKALALAGVKEADATHLRTERDTVGGSLAYEVKFTVSATNAEYESIFRASDGMLLHMEYDSHSAAPTGKVVLSEEEARQKALALAGVDAGDASFTRCKLDSEHGAPIYELRFTANSVQYEYELSAVDGSLLCSEQDLLVVTPVAADAASSATTDAAAAATTLNVSADAAKKTVLERVPGASLSDIRKCTLETEDGHLVYEIELKYDGVEYECVLDAASGRILEWESKKIFSLF